MGLTYTVANFDFVIVQPLGVVDVGLVGPPLRSSQIDL
jgi:hypothetical protein